MAGRGHVGLDRGPSYSVRCEALAVDRRIPDNEVDSSHPLIRRVEAIRKAGTTAQDIVLAPLTREDLEHLIADAVHCKPDRAGPLAQIIHDKTTGNPFFTTQFIASLAEEGLIAFDHGEGRWSWDLNRINAKGCTDNVVDLLVGKFIRMSADTQSALKQLACLGNSAEFTTLTMIYHDTIEQLDSQLWEAVLAGLVLRSVLLLFSSRPCAGSGVFLDPATTACRDAPPNREAAGRENTFRRTGRENLRDREPVQSRHSPHHGQRAEARRRIERARGQAGKALDRLCLSPFLPGDGAGAID